MKKFFTADLETDPFSHGRDVTAFASAVHDGESTRLWWGPDCIQKLLTWLRGREGIVYFHNGGRFDFHHLLRHLPLAEINPSPRMIGGRILALRWHGVEFRDSFALVPRALRTWKKDEIKIWKLKREHREKFRDEISSYLRGDVRYLHEMLATMLSRYSPKSFPLTLAGLTFRIMKRDFGVAVCRTPKSFDRRMRKFYFGGRVQFWKLGRIDGDFSILDLNSAYPHAMTRRHFWGEKMTVTRPRQGEPIDWYSFYEFSVTRAGGAFPLRTPDGLDFPEGGGRFFASGWEVAAARAKVKGLALERRYRPEKTQDFGAYVRYFFRLKDEAENPGERYFAKLILNSFYGKLAQNDENYRETRIAPFRSWPAGDGWEPVADDRGAGISIFQRPAADDGLRYCVAAGASITGFVRAMLWRAIAANPGTLYCDTDSLITPRPVKGCAVGPALGEWKEEMTCDVVFIAGKKLYAAHNAKAPWRAEKPARCGWIFVAGKGWTPATEEAWNSVGGAGQKPWKIASKGVRLGVADIIAVAGGYTRTYRQDAPTYSLGRDASFLVRRVRRADRRTGK